MNDLKEISESNKIVHKNVKLFTAAIGTVASAGICSYLLYLTHGEHGIGWFILSLIFLWLK